MNIQEEQLEEQIEFLKDYLSKFYIDTHRHEKFKEILKSLKKYKEGRAIVQEIKEHITISLS